MKHTFGPVASRRLGRSLGVDLVRHKICSLDCLYCECGPTTVLTIDRKEYVPVSEVIDEVNRILPDLADRLDFVTFSGSGEPTLSTSLGTVARHIKSITDVPVALLTNGIQLYREDVLRDIMDIDVVIPSLDSAIPETFQRLNRPEPAIDFSEYLSGLRNLKSRYPGKIWLEILLCSGINDSPAELQALAGEIKRISPDAVHLNTPVRPGSSPDALPLAPAELEAAAKALGIVSQQLAHPDYAAIRRKVAGDFRESVLDIVRRRPCTVDDLARGMGWPLPKLNNLIADLLHSGTIIARQRDGKRYYSAAGDSS